MDTIKIGNFLAELRKEQGLTQEALGEKLGVTNKTVSRWENGNICRRRFHLRSVGHRQYSCSGADYLYETP